jgi:hypothetical protein
LIIALAIYFTKQPPTRTRHPNPTATPTNSGCESDREEPSHCTVFSPAALKKSPAPIGTDSNYIYKQLHYEGSSSSSSTTSLNSDNTVCLFVNWEVFFLLDFFLHLLESIMKWLYKYEIR